MPIDIDRFHTAPEDELQAGGPTNGELVLSFLAANSERAFTPSEIREAVDVPRGSIGVVLSRLEDRELVEHRGEYWAVADEDDAATTLQAAATGRAASARFGGEDPDDWGPGAESSDADDGSGSRGQK